MRLGLLGENHRGVGGQIAHRRVLGRLDNETRRIERGKAPRGRDLAKDFGDAIMEDLKDVHILRDAHEGLKLFSGRAGRKLQAMSGETEPSLSLADPGRENTPRGLWTRGGGLLSVFVGIFLTIKRISS